MKSEHEWLSTRRWNGNTQQVHDFIHAIQADALRHAAELCRKRISVIKKTEYNVACDECAVFCKAEAERLTEGKLAAGHLNHQAKLSWETVTQIRKERAELGTSFGKLAKKYGNSKRNVMDIVHNRIWIVTAELANQTRAIQGPKAR